MFCQACRSFHTSRSPAYSLPRRILRSLPYLLLRIYASCPFCLWRRTDITYGYYNAWTPYSLLYWNVRFSLGASPAVHLGFLYSHITTMNNSLPCLLDLLFAYAAALPLRPPCLPSPPTWDGHSAAIPERCDHRAAACACYFCRFRHRTWSRSTVPSRVYCIEPWDAR